MQDFSSCHRGSGTSARMTNRATGLLAGDNRFSCFYNRTRVLMTAELLANKQPAGFTLRLCGPGLRAVWATNRVVCGELGFHKILALNPLWILCQCFSDFRNRSRYGVGVRRRTLHGGWISMVCEKPAHSKSATMWVAADVAGRNRVLTLAATPQGPRTNAWIPPI